MVEKIEVFTWLVMVEKSEVLSANSFALQHNSRDKLLMQTKKSRQPQN